jgi:hypothetical protein
MKFQLYDDELRIQFEALARDPADSWLRLRYAISDYWTGQQHEIDDKIYLAASQPRFGGLKRVTTQHSAKSAWRFLSAPLSPDATPVQVASYQSPL